MSTFSIVISLLLAAGLLTGLDATRVAAEVPAHERVLVTDPEVLESMGFPPDARNVFVRTGAGTRQTVEPQAGGLEVPRYFGPASSGFSAIAPIPAAPIRAWA